MTAEENKALVQRYIEEVWNRRNLGFIDEVLAPGYRRHLGPGSPPIDLQAQKKRLAGIMEAFPDIQLTVEDLFAEDDRVAFRVTFRGTHRGVFQGIAPTGKPILVSGLDIIRLEDGKFAEHWGGPDLLSWLQQVGAVVTPPAAAQKTGGV
jgi:steroid delta-isomerase-like uncharacterized protein